MSDSWKRKFEMLEAQCTTKKSATDPAASQVSLGRGLRRTVDMFHSAQDLVKEKHRRLKALNTSEDETLESEAMLRSFDELVKRVPLLESLIQSGDTEALEELYKNLRKGSNMARGDDAGRLRIAVVGWINDLYGPSEPELKTSSKDGRGFRNDHTGRLLCPAEYDWDDMSVRIGIRDGEFDYPVTANSWPMFCYANQTCDHQDLENGLFRGSLLVKAFKLIFTSLSSVEADNGGLSPPAKRSKKHKVSTRIHVATIIGLRAVTPRSIAYVAVQLRFALSNTTTWQSIDVDFNHKEFYSNIIDYFEVTPGPRAQARVKELLAWWNKQVFGRTVSEGPEGSRSHDVNSSVSLLAAQRRAREAKEDI